MQCINNSEFCPMQGITAPFQQIERRVYDAFSLYEHTLLFQGKVIRNGV